MTLSEYMKLNGLTATALATETGLAVSTITRLVRGERRPEWDTLAKITAATGGKVQPNDFAAGAK